ncbi:hypothetical protein CGRA01v4_05525 [Colletotrichum graminicola]|uniref:Uncharacterized protein n=1 Tax=Colletotrichum graminicola (strain M1.001 / M2 / FGSC 10212) TaxID=645133 RepID=E3Q6E8_COLGM|nr:uncharacterized protein GLRG_01540 [Colletotrichum graminicola M1.001]EFQ26396.1 hypothetical protein GLRG_01540 [Colletotrichum graminicola M1.001]WDK14244.1 hypothetical protein CGRA01v4_05525 [Colletotrichum graminicola]
METTANVEILVHVTAPCRTVDDARYRALAQAYLDFNPTSQTKIISGPSPSIAKEVIPSSQVELPELPAWSNAPPPILSSDATRPATSSPSRPPSPPPPISFGSFGSFRSQELSFRNVLDNRNSPGLARPLIPRDIVPSSLPEPEPQQTQSSWQAPPSTIGDSQPLNTVSLPEFSSPSRLFEHLACQFDSQAAGVSPQDSGIQQARTPAPAPEEEEDEDEDEGQVALVASSFWPPADNEATTSPAYSAEKVVERTPFAAFKRPLLPSSPFEQVIQDTPCQPSKKRRLPLSPTRAGSEPPLSSKRHRRSAPISESRSVITRSSSDVGTVLTDLYRPVRPPNERHLNYLDRLEIHPAGPPVGTTDLTPDDLLTPKLRELARQLNISKRYAPIVQERELRPFERGHWQLDWTRWRPTLRERAWHFLTDYILEGFAGWGVWCKRAEDWTGLRVYCWGHIAGHVYLALYLASERALKKDVARWVDGAGEVVVITHGHGNSESGESMDDGPDDVTRDGREKVA